jgi:hypothetical protein
MARPTGLRCVQSKADIAWTRLNISDCRTTTEPGEERRVGMAEHHATYADLGLPGQQAFEIRGIDHG